MAAGYFIVKECKLFNKVSKLEEMGILLTHEADHMDTSTYHEVQAKGVRSIPEM